MAFTSWVPQDGGLKEICELLAEYQKPSAAHAQLYRRIEDYNRMPEFSNYLTYLLVQGTNFPIEVRQCAGLLLKNKLKTQLPSLPPENLQYIYDSVLQALALPAPSLRQTAGTVMSTMVCAVGFGRCSTLVPHLLRCIESDDRHHIEGALDTIYKICEDGPQLLESLVMEGNDMTTALMQSVLRRLFDDQLEIRRLAIDIMNIVIGPALPSDAPIIAQFREGLFRLIEDPESVIQKEVCYGMTRLITFHQEVMLPYLQAVIRFMLECTKHGERLVAMESCEFWTAFVDAHLEPSELRPILSELIPVLLNNMVYDDDDEAVIAAQEANEEISETTSDLPPFIPRQDEDEADDIGSPHGAWTLRKCSAAGLDKLSTMFQDDLLPFVLPIIQGKAQSIDWKQRECALLVLGAISDGCRSGLDAHLQDILELILKCTADADPLVRLIACWALSRYAERFIQREMNGPSDEGASMIFDRILESLHDRNRQVQEAACSALATIEEFAGSALLPRFKAILENLAQTCRSYGRRNLRIVYDAISVLGEKYDTQLAQPDHYSLIMPALLMLYENTGDEDRELQPLFNCLSCIAVALGHRFEEYTVPIFDRCLRIIADQLNASDEGTAADGTAVVSALDLISGLVEGMGVSMESLIGRSHLVVYLHQCCRSTEADIRQSAFAALGEFVKICPSHLQSHWQQFLELCLKGFSHDALTENAFSACNNACWALGELTLQSSLEQLKSISMALLENTVNVMMHARCLPRSLVENAAITLGRASHLCAIDYAPHFHAYIGIWCQMLSNIRDDIEKEEAFTGLFETIRCNPMAAAHSFPSLCSAVASWSYGMRERLKGMVRETMEQLKQLLESKGEWETVWALVPSPVQGKLQDPTKW